MIWILGREEAAGGVGGEGGGEEEVLTGNFGEEEEVLTGNFGEEEELLTSNFGEDNRSETSRKWTKEKILNCDRAFFDERKIVSFVFFLTASSSVCTSKIQKIILVIRVIL